MSFNNGYEKKKFDQYWEKEQKTMSETGMDERAIKNMYEFDKEYFNSRRRYEERWKGEIPLTFCLNIDEAFEQNLDFMEQITDIKLYRALEQLKTREIELLKIYVIDGMTISEIAKMQGKSKSTISEKITRILKKLNYFYKNPNK